ncbi:pali-domain-containing protein [Rickenella mellea]|uniref:Pali-domain-containing protein n=1 Tax=Rickenella mellea TaxID=50990 RepID=A0A4Y7Q334_9AGAM|nr:pali-domain-containing protein [Rickenella mellea]
MASPAGPGLFFCFAACLLLIFVSVSSPTWEKISFLNVGNLHYGVFGHTGTGKHIGYTFDGIKNTGIGPLTKALILHPIAAGLSGLAVLFGICGASYHRAGTILMSVAASLAFLITLIIWVIDMIMFGIAKNRYNGNGGHAAQYGNANWLTLGALIALALGFCAGTIGSFGSYRRRRAAY